MFSEIGLWVEECPRRPAGQMAVDEVLLAGGCLCRPLLRHYRWLGHCASFGCSGSLVVARREAPGFELVRRWTGGGVVRHALDWTFSLLVPSAHPFAAVRPRDSYGAVHRAVVAALGALGIEARLAGPQEERPSPACFAGVSSHDALGADGAKICGGAQRRVRAGLLHQGSIQGIAPPAGFASALAHSLARNVTGFVPPDGFEHAVAAIAASRYAAGAWLARVP